MQIEVTTYFYDCHAHGSSVEFLTKDECILAISKHHVNYGCPNVDLNSMKFSFNDTTLDD